MNDINFTDAEYNRMEKIAQDILGWNFEDKCGMDLRGMIKNPDKGKAALLKVRGTANFTDTIKINKILFYLDDPNWKEVLKSKLS